MPRMEFRCDSSGKRLPDNYKAAQGEDIKTVSVTYDSKVTLKGYEDIIVKTALGEEELHKSTKVSGVGNLSAIGYIHGAKNTCFLVTRLDKAKHTIQIDKMGKVNAGKHEF